MNPRKNLSVTTGFYKVAVINENKKTILPSTRLVGVAIDDITTRASLPRNTTGNEEPKFHGKSIVNAIFGF